MRRSHDNLLSVSERKALITRHTREILGESELDTLLALDRPIRHYIGFEISGQVHLGTGLACLMKVKDFIDAGLDCTIFLADWHSWINGKLGGDLEAIRAVANGYFTEALRAAFRCLGGDPDTLHFVLGSDFYASSSSYWATVVEVSRHVSLSRMLRSITILGRQEGEAVDFAKLLYPAMQVADIFSQRIDIGHAGADQRKAHVLARDVASKLRLDTEADGNSRMKPVAVHHHLLHSLQKPPPSIRSSQEKDDTWSQSKMSKSVPASAVFIHDSPDVIRAKVQRAFCPPDPDFNPILNWTEHLVFAGGELPFSIPRAAAHGGPLTLFSFDEVRNAYVTGDLHPSDLKDALSAFLIDLLAPVRAYFSDGSRAEMLADIERRTVPR